MDLAVTSPLAADITPKASVNDTKVALSFGLPTVGLALVSIPSLGQEDLHRMKVGESSMIIKDEE